MDLFSLALGIVLGVVFDEFFTRSWRWVKTWWANRKNG